MAAKGSSEIDRKVARAVDDGDLDAAARALAPVVMSVARKFRTSIGTDEASAIAWKKLVEVLPKWDPKRGSVRPFLGVSMERAVLTHLRTEAKQQKLVQQPAEPGKEAQSDTIAAEWSMVVCANPDTAMVPGIDDVLAMHCTPEESIRIRLACADLIAAIAPVYVRSRAECAGVGWLDASLGASLAS